MLYLCWHNHRQMTNGFFQYFRTNAFPTQRPKFWVDLQDPFPTNLRHKGGHFSLLPTYLYQMENGIGDTMNTVRRLNSNMECFAATVPLFGLHKSSVPTENHFCVKLQWVRWLSQCSEKSSWNEIGQNNWTYFQKGLCYEFEGFLVGKSLQYCIKQWTFKVQRLNWFWLKVNRFYLLRVLVSLEIIGTVWVSIAYLA